MTWRLACFVLLTGGGVAPLPAADRSAADLLPPTVALYAELPRPPRTMRVLLDHPVLEKIKGLDEVQTAQRRKEYLAFQGVLTYVEMRLGMTWREAVERLTARGVTVAIDLPTRGLAVIVQAESEAALTQLRDDLMALARADAQNKGRRDPYQQHDYRGQTVYQVDKGGFATVGDRLILVNQGDLGRAIIDRLLDDDADRLSSQDRFAEAIQSRRSEVDAWVWVDVEVIRQQAARDGKPFQIQTDNPVAELLFGGLLDTFQRTPWLTATLELNGGRAALQFETPHRAGWVSEPRTHFFGPDGAGAASDPAPKGAILSLAAYRDISAMWRHAGDLFPERVVDKLAEADSNLTTLFAGKDFGEDILGAFGPVVRLVVAEQEFAADSPAIKLPAFALQFDLRDPAIARRELRRTFQSLVGFANITGAMNGQPQLELDMPAVDGVDLVTARFVLPARRDGDAPLPIQFNFSPSVAFAGSRFVLASTEGLARRLAAGTDASPTEDGPSAPNTSLRIDFASLRRILESNQTHLVTQNMLKEGHTRPEAERQIDLLFSLLDLLRDASLQLRCEAERLRLELQLQLNPIP